MGNCRSVVAFFPLLLASCMAFPKGDLPQVREWPPRTHPERRRPSVSLTINYESIFNGEKWVGPPEKEKESDEQVLREGTAVFKESALFSGVGRPSTPADLHVELGVHWTDSGSMLLAGLSVCTLGAVPMVCHSEVQAHATFRSRSGGLLGAVRMGERVTQIGWTPLLPAALVFPGPDRAELEASLYRAMLVEALRRGYLDP